MKRNPRPRPQRWRHPRRAGAVFRPARSFARLARTAAALGILGIFLFAGRQLRPVLRAMSAHEANIACTRAVSSAVAEQLAQLSPGCESLVVLRQDENGAVTAAQTNAAMADRLKTEVTGRILQAFEEESLQQAAIPLGTLTGSAWLNGRGPRIPMRIVPSRMVEVDIQSSFADAGINQTLHQLLLTVEADAEAIIPGLCSSTHVSSRFLLAETVIVGGVPQAYTSIHGAPELAGEIADYGAGPANGMPNPEAGAKTGQ